MATATAPDSVSPHVGTGPAGNATEPRPIVRLSVNLAPDVADVLKGWCARKGLSVTEGIRRAIAVWNFVETARSEGSRLALIEKVNGEERVREVMLLD